MNKPNAIAQQISEQIAADSEFRLPSIRELALQHSVSYPTMMRAVRLLADEGLVTCSQGRRPTVQGHREGSLLDGLPRMDSAAGRLAATFRSRVNGGELLSGEELPKTSFLAHAEHASPATIAEAFRILSREGCIHKRGRKWIVGPPSPGTPGTALVSARQDDRPTVLLLIPDAFSWHEYFSAGHLVPFSAAFSAEGLKSNLRLSLVFAKKTAETPSALPAGKEDVERFVISLGDQYRGALIYHHPPFGEEFQEVLSVLSSNKRPVVYLDATDEYPEFTTNLPPSRAKGYRLHFDEVAAVKIAVDTLCGLGHEAIGIPVLEGPRWTWAPRRFRLIRKYAASMAHPPRIVSTPLTEAFWRFDDYAEIGTSLRNLQKGGGEVASRRTPRSTRRMLRQATPSLASLIDTGVTAIIALNDRMAWEFLVWLRAAGIEVPRRLSLISFDNLAQSAVFPITSIDFGLARLGYLAAHIFIGDISVKADVRGDTAGTCRVVDRGSVRTPATT